MVIHPTTESSLPPVASFPYQELPGLPEGRIVDGAGRDDIPPATYNFRLYGGKMLELYGRNLYKLDGKLCKGAFTGDDFCNVSWGTIGVSRFSVSRYVQTPSFRGDLVVGLLWPEWWTFARVESILVEKKTCCGFVMYRINCLRATYV